MIFYLLAGYNNVEVAEFLLENGADVNAQDKGGLIPLHNASSYGVCTQYPVYDIMQKLYYIGPHLISLIVFFVSFSMWILQPF